MSETPLPARIRKVLFVCTGNSCRSVMAQKLFEKMAREKGLVMHSESAGTGVTANFGASPETAELLNAEGIDASAHVSRQVTQEMVWGSDLVCVMSAGHRDYLLRNFPDAAAKIFLLTAFCSEGGGRYHMAGVPDPIGMGQAFYDNVFSLVRTCLDGLIKILR